ncbi:hypothetical protein BFP75_09290 [Maribacter sp. 4G9]|nr:hypothetical protein BFP75_09290 [Maribacter sp. 4G9]
MGVYYNTLNFLFQANSMVNEYSFNKTEMAIICIYRVVFVGAKIRQVVHGQTTTLAYIIC